MKFHDYDLLFHSTQRISGRAVRPSYLHRLTGLPKGSSCVVFQDDDGSWCRKTINEGRKGSIRYEYFTTEQAALDAGVAWARRKDREAQTELNASAA